MSGTLRLTFSTSAITDRYAMPTTKAIFPPDLISCAGRGYTRSDEELPTLSLYGWAMAHLDHEPDDWDETAIHLSDYRYSLPPSEGGCNRQLWHRLSQDERKAPTLWMRVMWDQGFAMQIRYSHLICHGLPKPWQLDAVEADISEGLPDQDVGSCDLVLSAPGHVMGVEFKTQRGRAFTYLDEPKESHEIQSQGELYALKRLHPDKEVSHRLMYLDREGQNEPIVFETNHAPERVEKASQHANAISYSALDETPPDPIKPMIEVRENKGPNSIYLKEMWPCRYCDYRGESCPGALPDDLKDLGIVAKGNHDGPLDALDLKYDGPTGADILRHIEQAARAGNVKTK